MSQIATLILAADSSGLRPAVTDLASVKKAGADTEAGIKRSMKAVEQAMGKVPASIKMSARSFEDLRASIDPAFASSKAYAQVQKEVAALVQSGGATQRAANIVLEQAASKYMGVATASERAAAAQRANDAAVENATQSYTLLRMSVDSLYASSKRYEAAQEQVNAAVRAGVVSQHEANRTLAMIEASYLGAGNAAQVMGTQLRGASAHTTNLMFQFQDIGMMLAAGQSPLMLAMQQGTQVSGVFQQLKNSGQGVGKAIAGGLIAMISPLSLLTIGAIAGGAALVQWGVSAWGAAEDTEKMDDAIGDLNDSLGSISSAKLPNSNDNSATDCLVISVRSM